MNELITVFFVLHFVIYRWFLTHFSHFDPYFFRFSFQNMCKYFSVWSFVVIVWCTICKQTQTNLGHNCHLLMQNPKCYLLFFFLFDAIIVLLRLCFGVTGDLFGISSKKNRRNHHAWHDRHSTLKLGKTNQTPQIGNRR